MDSAGCLPEEAIERARQLRALSVRGAESGPAQDAPPAQAPPAAPAPAPAARPSAPAGEPPSEPPPRRRAEMSSSDEVVELKRQLLTAQVHEREAKAELLQLKAAHQRGDYVRLDDVVADARGAAETIRAALLALPGRVALQVEALAARADGTARAPQIEALIADEVNEILVALQGARYTR